MSAPEPARGSSRRGSSGRADPPDRALGRPPTPLRSAAAPGPIPPLRHSLTLRLSLLVGLVVLGSGLTAALELARLRELQSRFDLLTVVYVELNKRLADAHVQAVRIGEEIRRASLEDALAPALPEVDPAALRAFEAALVTRERLVLDARAPIDEALRHPARFGEAADRGGLVDLQRNLDELEALVALDPATVDLATARRDVASQAKVEQLLRTLASLSGREITELQFEVREARVQTERLIVGLTLVALGIGLLTMVAVVLTVRPLRQLATSVRRLAAGDWSERLGPLGRRDEVGQLAREFDAMAAALQERERRLLRGERLAAAGQLAAQVTHEIRNPLSSVALNAELLEDELVDASPEARALLQRITAEVDRLTAITEDYLGFARRPRPELQALDLTQEVERLLEFMAEEHEQAGVEVDWRDLGEPVLVDGDANQLRQALINVLRNAREAALERPRGPADRRGRIEVTVAVEPLAAAEAAGEPVAVVRIRDDGPGMDMPPGDLERIFEPFYTRKAQGTGLGLPIVQQIMADHRGGVRVAQTGPAGTTFELWLPACAPVRAPVSSAAPVDRAPAAIARSS